jgi:hypothetical protein
MKPKLKPQMNEVTVERLERAVALCAYLVVRDGPVMVPMFERLERELAAMRQTQDTVGRAKRLLESNRGAGVLGTQAGASHRQGP